MTPDNSHATTDCVPAREVLARIGDKWSTLILILLGDGHLRFNQLRRATGGVSQRMLSLTLKNLERDGLVCREVIPSIPPQVDYDLTPLGRSLWKPLKELGQWAIHHYPDIERARVIFDGKAD